MSPQAASRHRVPTLRHERRLLREGHLLVAGMDEVGRGALAGPVSVGVVVVDAAVRTAPAGVRDSKLLTPAARVALVPRLRRWAVSWAVGHAEPEEIDRYGIIAALRLAGRRALATLPDVPTCVLLDGSHDWLSPPRPRRTTARPPGVEADALFDLPTELASSPAAASPTLPEGREAPPAVPVSGEFSVLTMIKADLRCAAVAAASVLAKVERDAMMVERSELFPQYRWHENKGYSAPDHLVALRDEGPCEQHRRSWSLPLAGPGSTLDGGSGVLIDLAGLDDEPLEGEAPDEALDDEALNDDELAADEALDEVALPDETLDGVPGTLEDVRS